jgi:hypothetical protein
MRGSGLGAVVDMFAISTVPLALDVVVAWAHAITDRSPAASESFVSDGCTDFMTDSSAGAG